MARPSKKGLSYFPLDTDFLTNRKIQRLTQKYGHTGICTYLTLLCEIYRTHGYCIPYSHELCFDIGFTLQTDEKLVKEIIGFCLGIGLFDKFLFERQAVLSSEAIQARYLVVGRKRGVRIDPALVSGVSAPETGVSGSITGVSGTETPVLVPETPTNRNKIKENQNPNLIVSDNENEKRKSTTTDEERMAELLSMYNAATTDSPDV